MSEAHHRGISVEPLAFYQDLLPSPPGVVKESAAIDSKLDDPESDFGLLYYLDPNDLLAAGFSIDGPYQFMFGISSFGSVQSSMLEAYRQEALYVGTPSIFLQRRRAVPRLSMEELYMKHAVREVGIMKLDCEGLDIAILESYITMLQKYELPYPCVVEFEVIMDTDSRVLTALLSRLRTSAGYDLMSIAVPDEKANVANYFAIHPQCPDRRRREIEVFAPFLSRAEELCSGLPPLPGADERARPAYCCVTQYDNDGDDVMELCGINSVSRQHYNISS